MANGQNMDSLVEKLQQQLTVARNEIKNLRQQMVSLRCAYQKDVEDIQTAIKSNCDSCSSPCTNFTNGCNTNGCGSRKETDRCNDRCSCEFPNFQSIGKIETWFPEKRGIPRQGALCMDAQGVLTLNPAVINNPSYALSGLEDFSHLWILYSFHDNDSNHIRTMVAPPRLNGARVGVFSTRSPHRPCPIGMSVVKVEKICGDKIYFSGVDMLNGTPVLDIKPYIPYYDNPSLFVQPCEREINRALFDDVCSDDSDDDDCGLTPECRSAPECRPITKCKLVAKCKPTPECRSVPECRSAPDGEEDIIRVPSWIINSSLVKLKVEFTKKGLAQFEELGESEALKNTIISIIQEDPRSVYKKKRLGNQHYTFLIKDVNVTCRFDDSKGVVVICQVEKSEEECNVPPEWPECIKD